MISKVSVKERIISADDIDPEKIVLLDQGTRIYGLLTKDPVGKWFFTDMFNSRNNWPGVHDEDPRAVVRKFAESKSTTIYQFDTKAEFIEWLNENVAL